MLLFTDLIMLLLFGLAYDNIRECNLLLFVYDISNWFFELFSVLMVSFTVSITWLTIHRG